jgi:hypothetical protein
MSEYRFVGICLLLAGTALFGCRHRKSLPKAEPVVAQADTTSGKCRLEFRTARNLSRHMKEMEFRFEWLNAKANVESLIDGKEESFDIRARIRKDSAILISIQYILGLEVAKILITRDSVRFVNYIQKTYFNGDFRYINDLLNTDLDYELVQAVMFGNNAEFHDDDTRLKPVADRANCVYKLSTERKRRLRRIQSGTAELKNSLQIITLRPENFKIIKNEFSDPATSRKFIASYGKFTQKDSLYAPYHVDIEIAAEKNASVKIDYVRMEKNVPQKMTLNIPQKYEPVEIRRK